MASQLPVVLITGCSDFGIGAALGFEFAKRKKFQVAATARNLSKMHQLQLDCTTAGVQDYIAFFELDVTQDESVARCVHDVKAKLGGRIDILVNNAGISSTSTVAELPIDIAREIHETNVLGCLRMIQGVIPTMKEQHKGVIVNIGSITALIPVPLSGAYSASKAALHAYSDALRIEMKPFGIKVIVCAPGAVKSNLAVNNESAGHVVMSRLFPRETIMKRVHAAQGPDSTPSTVFASGTVNQIEQCWYGGAHLPYIFGGTRATQFRVLCHFPSWITDFLLDRKFKISETAQITN